MSTQGFDIYNSIQRLRRQYRGGVHTMNPCPECSQAAIGSDVCGDCIAKEMIANGASRRVVATLCQLLDQRCTLDGHIDEVIDMLLKQMRP